MTQHATPTRKACTRDAANFQTHQKPLCNRCFCEYHEFDFGFESATKIAFDLHERHREVMTLCRFYPGQNFFPQPRSQRPCAVVLAIENERIVCQVIRVVAFARRHGTPE